MKPNRSLQQIYRWRVEVPLLIVATTATLVIGLFLPALNVRKLIFWEDGWSMIAGIGQLWREGHAAVAVIILVFSVIFPIAKLLLLLGVWLVPQSPVRRHQALHWLGIVGKWSMLDVFVVALLVLISKTSSLLNATPRVGIYVFGIAIVVSMVLTLYVQYLAKRADAATMPTDEPITAKD